MKLSSNNLTECKLFVPKLFFSRQYMPLLLLRHIDTKKMFKKHLVHCFEYIYHRSNKNHQNWNVLASLLSSKIPTTNFIPACCLCNNRTKTLHLLPKYINFISKIHVDIFFTSIHLRNNSEVALFLCPFFKKGRKDCSLSLLLALGRLSPSSSVTTYIICNI